MEPDPRPRRTWFAKFADAFRGLRDGVRGESSFLVHGVAATLVIGLAVALRVSACEWCLLTLSIAGVVAAELFNSALESLARAVDRAPNVDVGRALDIASGAVLAAACGAAIVGLVVFVPRLWAIVNGWA